VLNGSAALFSHGRLYKFYSAENPISEVKQSGTRKTEPGVLAKTQLEELLSIWNKGTALGAHGGNHGTAQE
jgi:hypothetical protein